MLCIKEGYFEYILVFVDMAITQRKLKKGHSSIQVAIGIIIRKLLICRDVMITCKNKLSRLLFQNLANSKILTKIPCYPFVVDHLISYKLKI